MAFAFIAMFASCSSNKEPERKFVRNPVDDMIRDMNSEQNFSIILYDMDEQNKKYRHKYQIIVEKSATASLDNEPKILRGSMNTGLLAQASQESNSVENAAENIANREAEAAISDTLEATGPAEVKLEETMTDWKEVSEDFFYENIDNMGMEVASKIDGKVSKVPSPPGYNKYVGNEKYGQWRTNSSGGSFWHFYGQYMFMSTMFNMMSPVSRGGYQDYNRNYRGKQAYYGKDAAGKSKYGTNSAATKKKNPDFYKRRQSNKSLTQSAAKSYQTKRASSAPKSSSTRSSSGTRKTTRSSSRSGSSSRSRGGGGGGK